MIYVILILFGLSFVSCEVEKKPLKEVSELVDNEKIEREREDSMAVARRDSATSGYVKAFGLVNILDVDPTIRVDLRYATSNNFMGYVLYDTLNALYLQEDVAMRISECQTYLKSKFPSYSLLIYDGVRPLEVQREMWNALDSIPVFQRGKFVSNPAYGSVHNYGAAVDLTICDAKGIPLDMGAGYDDFRDIAFPSMEWKFIQSGELTEVHIANRKLLREVMKSQGFRNIPTEWWHFNACSRNQAVAKYRKLVFESGVEN